MHVVAQFEGRTLYDVKHNVCKIEAATFGCPMHEGEWVLYSHQQLCFVGESLQQLKVEEFKSIRGNKSLKMTSLSWNLRFQKGGYWRGGWEHIDWPVVKSWRIITVPAFLVPDLCFYLLFQVRNWVFMNHLNYQDAFQRYIKFSYFAFYRATTLDKVI